jgi:hypothetical protein
VLKPWKVAAIYMLGTVSGVLCLNGIAYGVLSGVVSGLIIAVFKLMEVEYETR